jgi:membrane protease YdiL (CAAX protease family)
LRKPQLKDLKSITIVFLPAALFLSIITYIALPSKFFSFPTSRPNLWLIVMLLYPPLGVLPQELLFRCFFFHRYRTLFKGKERQLIFLNALSFGLSHIFYANWIAPVLSFFGGLLFAWRYHVSSGLFTVALEHALWGNFLFTTGIGWYFYSGSIT